VFLYLKVEGGQTFIRVGSVVTLAMGRHVHAEGQRERANQRSGVTHNHDDPKPRKRADGRNSWCCHTAYEKAKEMGKFEDGEYVGEYE